MRRGDSARKSQQDAAPFAGVRVVEFCNVAAGPFCAMLLADMGADVVKVEPPTGDALRQWPPIQDGFSENFASLNRNKRSIALDLKDESQREQARALISAADVVVENNRPGAMSRLGLGYEAFRDAQPRLIYCSLSAYGQEGPRAGAGGFDLTIQAISGIMSVTGEADGDPVKAGVPVSDFATGLYGAFAIAALLARVRAGGRGGHIDVSMLGASLAISALQVSEYFGTGRNPERLGAAHPRNAPYQAFEAADGRFVLAAGNDGLWRQVCEVVGRPDLPGEARFASPTERARCQTELADILNRIFRRAPVAEWLSRLDKAGVPCAPINGYAEALADPQVAHMGWVQNVQLPTGRWTRSLGSPIRVDGTTALIVTGPPALDQDRHAVLEELALLGRGEAST